MGLGNAIHRVLILQAPNILRLCKWLFWGAVFFVGGLSLGLYLGLNHNSPQLAEKIPDATLIAYTILALLGFLLRLWEWRLNRPLSPSDH